MAIPSKPIKLVKFRWKTAGVPAGAASIPKPFVLREAGEQELDDALRVIRASYDLDPEWSGCAKHVQEFVLPGIKKAFDSGACCLFVQHGNRVIAASAYLPEPGDAGVHLVSGPCVLSEYRNRGIAGTLLAATLEALASRGVKEAIGQARPYTPATKYLCVKFGGEVLPAPVTANAMAEEAVAA